MSLSTDQIKILQNRQEIGRKEYSVNSLFIIYVFQNVLYIKGKMLQRLRVKLSFETISVQTADIMSVTETHIHHTRELNKLPK